jgi:hypothetical protein
MKPRERAVSSPCTLRGEALSDDVFLKFDYDARDIFNALRVRVTRKPGGRATLALGFAVFVAGAALVGTMAPAWVRLLAVWLVVLATVQMAFSLVRIVPHAMFRKSSEDERWTAEARSDFWNRKMSVDASEEGIVVTVGRRSATIKWKDCVRFASDARSHVIYHGASGFLVVPRRAFRNEKKDAAFRDLAARLVPGRDEAAGSLT